MTSPIPWYNGRTIHRRSKRRHEWIKNITVRSYGLKNKYLDSVVRVISTRNPGIPQTRWRSKHIEDTSPASANPAENHGQVSNAFQHIWAISKNRRLQGKRQNSWRRSTSMATAKKIWSRESGRRPGTNRYYKTLRYLGSSRWDSGTKTWFPTPRPQLLGQHREIPCAPSRAMAGASTRQSFVMFDLAILSCLSPPDHGGDDSSWL